MPVIAAIAVPAPMIESGAGTTVSLVPCAYSKPPLVYDKNIWHEFGSSVSPACQKHPLWLVSAPGIAQPRSLLRFEQMPEIQQQEKAELRKQVREKLGLLSAAEREQASAQ